MIIIENRMVGEYNDKAFWKIWEEQMDLQFFEAQKYDSKDDNELEALKQIGKIQTLGKDEQYFLFVVNPTLEERNFKLNYAGAAWLSASI